ncbi:MAG: glycoside hydrolase family 9 protein [Bacteroidia bacterium]
MYQVKYGETLSIPFQISPAVYDRHVWQPTLEYYLPVQMCHMRINDRYKVWHGLCHDDDALMAPVDLNHFDGYVQGKSTLTQYQPHQSVPGLNVGGWHDAGDYDLRVESQATTTRMLAYMYELFQVNYDATTIDQAGKIVEMHRPDGKPDVLQQIEHGALTVVGGYEALGRLYRGIICSDLRQYTLLGDGMVMTDNLKYDPSLKKMNAPEPLPASWTTVGYLPKKIPAAKSVWPPAWPSPTAHSKVITIPSPMIAWASRRRSGNSTKMPSNRE